LKANATAAEISGKQGSEAAATKAAEIASATRQRLGIVQAGAAQDGFEMTGAPLDIIKAVGQQGGLDELTSVYNGDVNLQAKQAEARSLRKQASSALLAGWLKAGSSILSGGSNAYTQQGQQIASKAGSYG
jgi:hypothetical protein